MKKILLGLFVLSSFVSISSQVYASEYIYNNDTTYTSDLTPRISYWQGKVNQHVDIATGTWQTDADGTSGGELDKLTYCKKFYPNTTSISEYKTETINTWKDRGNYSNFVGDSKMSYKCIEGINNTAPSITVLSPNGEEVYQAGQQITIRWKTENTVPGNFVHIGYYSSLLNMLNPINEYTPNDGEETITVPSEGGQGMLPLASGNYYKIRLSINGNPSLSDQSDNYFTINNFSVNVPVGCTSTLRYSPLTGVFCGSNNVIEANTCLSGQNFNSSTGQLCTTPSITVLTPNGRDTYEAGQQINVTWNSTGIPASNSNIDIILHGYNSNGVITWSKELSSFTINDGQERIVLPTNLGGIPFGKNFVISVGTDSTNNPSPVYDYSDSTFSINSPIVVSLDKTPRISFWPGKVNQHIDVNTGNWLTDSDGVSGGHSSKLFSNDYGDRPLEYCKKFYPKSVSVSEYKLETINTWKDAGNYGNYVGANKMSYKCVEGTDTIDLSSNPVITGVSGPQSLNVNQIGTWTVSAKDTIGRNLSYSVYWGDENYTSTSQAQQLITNKSQSATFTHSYSKTGNYTPIFTVTGENTIRCVMAPCSSNAGSAKTSINLVVNNTLIDNGCLNGAVYSSITGAACKNTQDPSLTIISPIGGEVYQAGQQITVNWKSQNAPIGQHIGISLEHLQSDHQTQAPSDANGSQVVTLVDDIYGSVLVSDGSTVVTLPNYTQTIGSNYYRINAWWWDTKTLSGGSDTYGNYIIIKPYTLNNDSCSNGSVYSSITGQKCQISTIIKDGGCNGSRYSTVTGKYCANYSGYDSENPGNGRNFENNFTSIHRTLKHGIIGDDVKALQEYLGINNDGVYGRGTILKVKEWQINNGIYADGIFGQASRNKWNK